MKFPILLPNIFNHPFTYESDYKLKVGEYVVVPFGKSKITGVVWDEFEKGAKKNFKIKKILQKLEITNLKKLGIKTAYTTTFTSKKPYQLGRIDCNQFSH